MPKIAIATDSNSGITLDEAKALGVAVLPMPFYINDQLYYEEISLSQEEFYRFLEADANIATSQPVPADVTDLWDGLLRDADEVVYIPMSSGLSGACETAMLLAQEYGGRVQVVDNQRISVTQRQSVLDALALAERGRTAAQIRETLERVKGESSIYITLETLKYLKKGGRITPAAAAIGTVLNLKPVLQIQGERLDAYAKARGKRNARRMMIAAMRNDLDTRFLRAWRRGQVHLEMAYAGNPEEAESWREELEAAFPGVRFHRAALSRSVACHIGPGALAVACSVALPEDA